MIDHYLEEEIKRELRQRGIVVWLDKDNHYGSFVDRLADRHTQEPKNPRTIVESHDKFRFVSN